MPPTLSYAQRFEDLYLLRCFGDQADGFYIDIGAGHPVVDNVSFAFYLRGWHGITVEPNPYLARLSRAVRPRDHGYQELVGAAPGAETFFLVQEFHGFSTMVERHAEAAHADLGKPSERLVLPVTTLRELCARHAPPAIDFLKIDVEGAERDVLLGADWQRFRPKIVLLEALAPFTLAPAWEDWEPLLLGHGYSYAFFDSLNRYYVADEAAALKRHFETAPKEFENTVQFGVLQPALAEETHPDRGLAALLARAAMTRLPLLSRELMLELVTLEVPPAQLAQAATPADVAAIRERLLGTSFPPEALGKLEFPAGATVGEVYARLVDSDAFRLACGRISASYAW